MGRIGLGSSGGRQGCGLQPRYKIKWVWKRKEVAGQGKNCERTPGTTFSRVWAYMARPWALRPERWHWEGVNEVGGEFRAAPLVNNVISFRLPGPETIKAEERSVLWAEPRFSLLSFLFMGIAELPILSCSKDEFGDPRPYPLAGLLMWPRRS
ncbi:uncharacterized protein HMPREF1120_08273 [Exophiala dermatitidis NIH/UT8656]|uniref:Uncharacterized protein n=1 Tax=Exophiala dermatitidis (strain ATCC 34100 / CBS 525.76 / NIH/UT8656) TaxID=858893 RepID=H6C880_EXODN|nr:uncharacterized protein HMPREF1120_08273 [Exophiala dermatitidis NIH/UT8656]EHY60307.1 hypothetical protein HMPREF1120_08273 [Exophiala dermatitidis NIH/UT8656]